MEEIAIRKKLDDETRCKSTEIKRKRKATKSIKISRKKLTRTTTIPRCSVVIQTSKAMGNKTQTDKKIVDKVSDEARKALLRGRGNALIRQHGHGCGHYGILDLPVMSQKRMLDHYCQAGRWFHGSSCLDCSATTKDMTPQKGSGAIVYYCEMGMKANSIDAKKQKEKYEAHACNCILCPGCHAKRLSKHLQGDNIGITGQSSSRRRKQTPIYD